MNKNMAEYTTFEGKKANKNIVQPPGGSSGFTLGWGNSTETYQQNPRNSYQKSSHENRRYEEGKGYQKINSYGQNPDQIDLAMKAHQQSKSEKRISEKYINQNQRERSTIRINPTPRQNLILGDPKYNYWDSKNDNTQIISSRNQGRDLRQNTLNDINMHYEPNKTQERSSVRINNPPGGKQTFSFT